MATKTQEQVKAKLDEDKRNKILNDAVLDLSRKDKREARENLGISQEEMEDDYQVMFIMVAKKRNPHMTWDELDSMGQRELALAIWGADLVPEELK